MMDLYKAFWVVTGATSAVYAVLFGYGVIKGLDVKSVRENREHGTPMDRAVAQAGGASVDMGFGITAHAAPATFATASCALALLSILSAYKVYK